MAKKYLDGSAVTLLVQWAKGKFAAIGHKHRKADITDFPVVLTGGNQTVASDADGGENIYTFTDSAGKTSTLTVKNGAKGSPGTAGAAGTAATITVGTVTTGAAGSQAAVTNIGTANAAKLNFTIPQGAAGKNGAAGAAGTAATITVGTVTTGAAGSQAAVTNVGTANAAKLNFTIPQGAAGKNGAAGAKGADGLTTKVSVNGTAYSHSNGTVTIPDSAIQAVAKNACLPLAGGTVTGTLVLSKNTDASGTANNSPALIVGGTAAAKHIEIDANEVLAKDNGTTPTTLSLQSDGGGVQIGSAEKTCKLTVRGDIDATKYNIYGKAVTVSTGTGTKTINLPAGRTKAVIDVWMTNIVISSTAMASNFGSVYIGSLSSSMTAVSKKLIISSSSTTCSYDIAANGAITLNCTQGTKISWRIIYFN